MGEVIWVEILSRSRDVLSRQRVALGTSGSAKIGRGYDCDVLVDDPYVAPAHVRIARDEAGRLFAEDLGSVNGLFLDQDTTRRARIDLDGHTPIRLGRTLVRIRDASAAVAPEREQPLADRTWHAVLALSAALILLTLLDTWLADTSEPKTSTYAFSLFSMGAFVGSWTALWAVQARIFGGNAHFERHLGAATTGFLVLLVGSAVLKCAAYSFSLTSLAVVQSFGFWVWLAVLGFVHLREIGPQHLVRKGVVVAVLGALGIGGQVLAKSEAAGFFGSQLAVTALEPPWMRVATPQTETRFFADVESLKPALDRARTEEPPSGGLRDAFNMED
ncbi:MAG TPA: FHA domain-containing protein [Candidatus Binatia bacterium]